MEESKKNIHVILYVILSGALICAVIFGVYQKNSAESYSAQVQMDYQRVFTEMTQYVDDLQMSLEKSMFVSDADQMMRLSGEIYREAADAKANLALLPLSQEPLEKFSVFLSQAGDYAYSLSQKMLEGESVTEEEYSNLKNLAEYAGILAASLDEDLEKLYNGTLSLSEAGKGVEISALDEAMGEIEGQFHDYPALIYDGPFSSHLTDRASELTKDLPEITKDEAILSAKALTGIGDYIVQEENASVPRFYLSGEKDGESVSVGYTKKGGYLDYYLKSREIADETIDLTQARLIATEFLNKLGYKNMTESYYENVARCAVINFAAEQEGYTLYPDLIKVKVALDTGEVIGVEARGYIMYHKERTIPKEKVSAEQARAKVNSNVEFVSISRSVIPTDGGGECFCWQVEGRIGDRRCLIYINTQSGAEEKLFLLIESPSGVLAV